MNSSKTTQFVDIEDSSPPPASYQRILYSLAEVGGSSFSPPFHEVDLVGYVLSVETSTSGFQNVNICDQTGCGTIKVWGGVESVGLKDVLAAGRVVSFRDLEVRGGRGTEQIPSLYVREHTTVTGNPRLKAHAEALNALRQFVKENPENVETYRCLVQQKEQQNRSSRPNSRSSSKTSSTPVQGKLSDRGWTSNPSSCTPTPRPVSSFCTPTSRLNSSSTPTPRLVSSAWTPQNATLCRDENQSLDKRSNISDRLARLDAYTERLAREGCTVYSPTPLPSTKPFIQTPYRAPRVQVQQKQKELCLRMEVESSVESQELEGIFMNVMDELNV